MLHCLLLTDEYFRLRNSSRFLGLYLQEHFLLRYHVSLYNFLRCGAGIISGKFLGVQLE